MKTKVIIQFEFFGDTHNITIPLKEIDTEYYGEIWTYWDSFKQEIWTEIDDELTAINVEFDCEIIADCDDTAPDRIGFENAFIYIYQKDSDKIVDTIMLQRYNIVEE